MVYQDTSGRPSAEFMPHEAQPIIEQIFSLLDFPRTISRKFSKKDVSAEMMIRSTSNRVISDEDLYWLQTVFYNLVLHGTISLPQSKAFYANDNLRDNMALRLFFGTDPSGLRRITHARAQLIAKLLDKTRLASRLPLLPNKYQKFKLSDEIIWKFKPGTTDDERQILYYQMLSVLGDSPRNVRINLKEKSRAKTAGAQNDSTSTLIPQALQELLQYVNTATPAHWVKNDWVFSQSLDGANRLYGKFSSLPREKRKAYLKFMELDEADISACAYQSLYLYETNSPFDKEGFGRDYYKFLASLIDMRRLPSEYYTQVLTQEEASEVFTQFGQPLKLDEKRAIVKGLLTAAIGDTRNTTASKTNRLISNLGKAGVCPIDREYVTINESKKRPQTISFSDSGFWVEHWEIFRREHAGGRIVLPEERPFIDTSNLLKKWEEACPIFKKFGFQKAYILAQKIETLMNMMLYDFAIQRGIKLATIHDAAYCRHEHIETIREKQAEFLKQAAFFVRRWESMKSNSELHASKSELLELLPERLRAGYDAIVTSSLTSQKTRQPWKSKTYNKDDAGQTPACSLPTDSSVCASTTAG